jgi:hypothetical protein
LNPRGLCRTGEQLPRRAQNQKTDALDLDFNCAGQTV